MWGEKNYRKDSNDEDEPDFSKENRFTASRARGLMALVAILFLFQIGLLIFNKCIRKTQPEHELQTHYRTTYYKTSHSGNERYKKRYSTELSPFKENKSSKWGKKSHSTAMLFYFNPNIISADSLVLLGLSEKQAATIIKYREKGGKFRRKEDFAKMYTVSEEFYRRIENYIKIWYPDTKSYKISTEPNGNSDNRQIPEGATFAENNHKRNFTNITKTINSPIADCKAVDKSYSGNDSKGTTSKIIDLNLADSTQLLSLYGIGPYFAKKIIEYRKRLGSYAFIEQLTEINGIDNERIEGFKNRVTISDEHIIHFSLDTVSVAFMKRHPYIGSYAAQGILLLRETLSKRGIKSNETHITPQHLLRERIVPAEQVRKLMFYCN
jgi:competence ComEA-like helix-hairpin-helix protein